MSMVGGFVLENVPTDYEDEYGRTRARRVWLVNSLGDECAIYVDEATGQDIGVYDYVWWVRGGRAFWNATRQCKDESREVNMLGFPFDPCDDKTLEIV